MWKLPDYILWSRFAIIIANITAGRMPGFCLANKLPLSFISVSQLGRFEYPVTVITVDSAHLRVLKN